MAATGLLVSVVAKIVEIWGTWNLSKAMMIEKVRKKRDARSKLSGLCMDKGGITMTEIVFLDRCDW